MTNVVLSWSGGKDSSLCLFELRRQKSKVKIIGLLTTVTLDYERISMHGVRRELLLKQANSVGLPLSEVSIPKNATNEIYEAETSKVLSKLKMDKKVMTVAFGDLFLEDIRAYREKFLERLGMEGIFPIWRRDTSELANYFIESGFRAKICCVDPKRLGKEFCGRDYDKSFLSSIPENVDPCGENGEFHTFVYGGPIFKEEIKVTLGQIVERDSFCFADILPN